MQSQAHSFTDEPVVSIYLRSHGIYSYVFGSDIDGSDLIGKLTRTQTKRYTHTYEQTIRGMDEREGESE